ncbi:MAG: nucleotidyltransferase domain-containing protein [Kribbellaceae bacterium]|nr:nucleotidyltransferase domain-containing protein [Kribbellaceae bacterium]
MTLAHLRDRWLRSTTSALQDDPAVVGAALVGSLGAGRGDEWSDVDLLVVVEGSQHPALPGKPVFAIDARHNGPRGTRAISAQYVVDGLPLWVDWHLHPISHAAWPSDSKLLFEHCPVARTPATFTAYLNTGEREPATPKTPAEEQAMRLALIPIAAKQIARHDPEAARTITFLGGPPVGDQDRPAQLAALHQLLDTFESLHTESLAAARAYLALLET